MTSEPIVIELDGGVPQEPGEYVVGIDQGRTKVLLNLFTKGGQLFAGDGSIALTITAFGREYPAARWSRRIVVKE